MLLTLIGLAAAGVVGYNAVKDEESRQKTGQIIKKTAHFAAEFTEKMGAEIDKQYERGKIDEASYQRFDEARQKYQDAKVKAEARKNGDYYD